jgi:outer membrane protein OmpA-like peptidoglycan-associated protein
MQNVRPTQEISGQMLNFSTISYRGFEGVYQHDNESLENMKEAKGEVRGDVKEARVAVELAKRAGAERFAPDELRKALDSQQETMEAAEAKIDQKQLMLRAHETVRLALEAQVRAEERSMQAALDTERKEHANEISDLEVAISNAKSETERAELLARQREMQLQIEQEARKRSMADAQRAWEEAQRAQQEREEARERMQLALSKVLETRMTARGLIMNVPDILFEFNKSDLKPQARETLSRVCGILQVAEGYKLGFEGHTDSVGSDEYNQALSEHRAQSVRDYLVSCGLSPDIMTTRGFGEMRPIASNDTADGRQTNRRVDIVVQDEEDSELSYLP